MKPEQEDLAFKSSPIGMEFTHPAQEQPSLLFLVQNFRPRGDNALGLTLQRVL